MERRRSPLRASRESVRLTPRARPSYKTRSARAPNSNRCVRVAVALCLALTAALVALVASDSGASIVHANVQSMRQAALSALARRSWPEEAARLSAYSAVQLSAAAAAAVGGYLPSELDAEVDQPLPGGVVTTIASYAERRQLANWICLMRRRNVAFVVGCSDEFLVSWLAIQFPSVVAVLLDVVDGRRASKAPLRAPKLAKKSYSLIGDYSDVPTASVAHFRHRMQLRLAMTIALVDAGYDAFFISVDVLVVGDPVAAMAVAAAQSRSIARGTSSLFMYEQRETRNFPWRRSKQAEAPISLEVFFLSAGHEGARIFARASAVLAVAKDWTRACVAVDRILKDEREGAMVAHYGACGSDSDVAPAVVGLATCELDPWIFADVYATKPFVIAMFQVGTEDRPPSSPVLVTLYSKWRVGFMKECGYWVDGPDDEATPETREKRCLAHTTPSKYCGVRDYYLFEHPEAAAPEGCERIEKTTYISCPRGVTPQLRVLERAKKASVAVPKPMVSLQPQQSHALLDPVVAADAKKLAALVEALDQRCYVNKAKRPDLADVAIITVARFADRKLLSNWICAIERIGLDYLVFTPDSGLVVWLREHAPKSKVVMMQTPSNLKVPYLVQRSFLRFRAVLALIAAGKSVLYVGQDALVVQDPIAHMLPSATSISAFDFRYQQDFGTHFPFKASRGLNMPGNGGILFVAAGERTAQAVTNVLQRMVNREYAVSAAMHLTLWELLWQAHDAKLLTHAGRCAGAPADSRTTESMVLRTCELDPWLFPAGYAMQPTLTPWVQLGGIHQNEAHFGARGSPPMRPLVLSSSSSGLSQREIVRFLHRCGLWFSGNGVDGEPTCAVGEASLGAFCGAVEYRRVPRADSRAPMGCRRVGAFFDCAPEAEVAPLVTTLQTVHLSDVLSLNDNIAQSDASALTMLPLPSDLDPRSVVVDGTDYNVTLLRNLARRAAGCYADVSRRRPGIAKVVISTLGNFAFRSQLTNWICFAQRHGLTFIVFAVDRELGPWLDKNFPDVLWIHIGASQFLHDGDDFSNFAAFRRGAYNVLMKVKLATTLSLLKLGYDNFYVDADCVMLRDFVDDLLGTKGDGYRRIDLHYQQNHGTRFPWLRSRGPTAEGNGGMFLAVSSPRTVRVWEIAMRQMDARPDLDDQANFYTVVINLYKVKAALHYGECSRAKEGLGAKGEFTYCELDPWLYPTGYIAKAWVTPMFQLGGVHKGTKVFGAQGTPKFHPFIVHPNFIRGEKHKVSFLKQCGYYLVAGAGLPDSDPLRCSAAALPSTFCGAVKFEHVERYANVSSEGWTAVDPAKKNAVVDGVHVDAVSRSVATPLLAALIKANKAPGGAVLVPAGCKFAGTEYFVCDRHRNY